MANDTDYNSKLVLDLGKLVTALTNELDYTKDRLAIAAADNNEVRTALINERRAHEAIRDVLARHITTNATRGHSAPPAAFTAPAGGYDCGGPRCGHQPCICDPEPADHPAPPASAITRTRQRIGLLVP